MKRFILLLECSIELSMWSIGDGDAPEIASKVYSELCSYSNPDPRDAARQFYLSWAPMASKNLRLG
ncbi:hypothetical protein NEOLEDRAFT_1213867 [Neolentinus lepideus HHB14362 ss-1]|uniref:Uncharacterized protein n=1 Tax=Neolentinus lepideus HHB14362 ss-1 TaxID=1314782 RepID=A0A165R0E8_9AGAM|nr:hypothetical protein NEOLEDRAFT_1213867 [Neolentinus lepideus HHB14362 ss-1]